PTRMNKEEAWSRGPANATGGSIRVRQFALGVVLRVLLVRDDGLHRDPGSPVEVGQRLEGQWPEARVRLDTPADPAIDDSLNGTLRAVDRQDLHVAGLLARILQQIGRASC